MNTSITNDITDGQVKQVGRFLDDTKDRIIREVIANLDKYGGQRFLENGGEFQTEMIAVAKDLSGGNRFAKEELFSSYGYYSGYEPMDISGQANHLRGIFPGLGYANQCLIHRIISGDRGSDLPAGAEGWFAIPNWMKNPGIFGKNYAEAVQKVFEALGKHCDGGFINYKKESMDLAHFRQSTKVGKIWLEIAKDQGNPDILVIPAQFGLRHRGRSVRLVREIVVGSEFGLGAFAVGCMLLTHPKRLMSMDDLRINLPGDQFSPDALYTFPFAPRFFFRVSDIEFDAVHVSRANSQFGSATGFFSEK